MSLPFLFNLHLATRAKMPIFRSLGWKQKFTRIIIYYWITPLLFQDGSFESYNEKGTSMEVCEPWIRSMCGLSLLLHLMGTCFWECGRCHFLQEGEKSPKESWAKAWHESIWAPCNLSAWALEGERCKFWAFTADFCRYIHKCKSYRSEIGDLKSLLCFACSE